MNLGKEKLERDALNRITWDKNLNPGDFSIRYIDRASQKMKEVGFTDIGLEGDFFRYGDSLIPMHRIRKILCKDRVVWDRRRI